jgi:hypothetical protein
MSRSDAVIDPVQAAYARGVTDARNEVTPWLNRPTASLRAGEMSAQEWRTLQAVLQAYVRRLNDLIRTNPYGGPDAVG